MATQIHGLSVEKYNSQKKCDNCGEDRSGGFQWLVVTCACGCGAKKRTCEICPAGLPPTCDGIEYRRSLNKECTTT